jgi:hypothetical protein
MDLTEASMRYVRRALLLGLLVAMALYEPPAHATCSTAGIESAYAHETITVSSTALGFTNALYEQGSGNAASALVAVETNAIRWWADGTTTPTASVGMPAAANATLEICGFSNIKKFRMIRQTSDASVSVSYFR